VVGLDRSAVSRIVQNTKFGEMHNLLTQGRDMDYIDLLKDSGREITHMIDCPMSPRAVGSTLSPSCRLYEPEATQRFQANIVVQVQKTEPWRSFDAH